MALDTSHPQPAGPRDAGPSPATAGWQYVRDLPTPPELAQVIEEVCRRRGYHRWWRKRLRVWQTDWLKLEYHYAGKVVAVMPTARGPVVLAVGDSLADPAIAHLRDRLSPEENERTALDFFPPWKDDTTYV